MDDRGVRRVQQSDEILSSRCCENVSDTTVHPDCLLLVGNDMGLYGLCLSIIVPFDWQNFMQTQMQTLMLIPCVNKPPH